MPALVPHLKANSPVILGDTQPSNGSLNRSVIPGARTTTGKSPTALSSAREPRCRVPGGRTGGSSWVRRSRRRARARCQGSETGTRCSYPPLIVAPCDMRLWVGVLVGLAACSEGGNGGAGGSTNSSPWICCATHSGPSTFECDCSLNFEPAQCAAAGSQKLAVCEPAPCCIQLPGAQPPGCQCYYEQYLQGMTCEERAAKFETETQPQIVSSCPP